MTGVQTCALPISQPQPKITPINPRTQPQKSNPNPKSIRHQHHNPYPSTTSTQSHFDQSTNPTTKSNPTKINQNPTKLKLTKKRSMIHRRDPRSTIHRRDTEIPRSTIHHRDPWSTKNHCSPATPSTRETHKLERQLGIEKGKWRGREKVTESEKKDEIPAKSKKNVAVGNK